MRASTTDTVLINTLSAAGIARMKVSRFGFANANGQQVVAEPTRYIPDTGLIPVKGERAMDI